jgi:hypothetical protein
VPRKVSQNGFAASQDGSGNLSNSVSTPDSTLSLFGDKEVYSMEFMAGRQDRIKMPSRKNVVVEDADNAFGVIGSTAALSSRNMWPHPILQVRVKSD